MASKQLFVLPYKKGSKGAKAIAQAMGCRRIRLKNSSYKDSPDKVIINWGNSHTNFQLSTIINPPSKIRAAANKLSAFRIMQNGGVSVPGITTSREDAYDMLLAGHTVVCRTLLSAHSGEGIVLASGDSLLPVCPLYTRYIKKTVEYRVHVVSGEVVGLQQKRRRKEVPDENVDWQIRNYRNGFIYAVNNVEFESEDIRQAVEEQALLAVNSLGLDFGAVDIIVPSEREDVNIYGRAVVLEVNTAPGLESPTILGAYKQAFEEIV